MAAAAQAPAQPATVQPVEVVAPTVAPKRPRKPKASIPPVPVPTPVELPPIEPIAEAPIEVVPPKTFDMAQPGLAAPAKPADDYAPPIVFDEKPGGPVLVLGVLVEQTGGVLDSRILVPSHNAMGDLTFALAARNTRMEKVDPPLAIGERRWVVVRFRYSDKDSDSTLIP